MFKTSQAQPEVTLQFELLSANSDPLQYLSQRDKYEGEPIESSISNEPTTNVFVIDEEQPENL